MYNARQVEAKKKEERKISSIERMLRDQINSKIKAATTEKGLESDRTGKTDNVSTEKQLEKMRGGTRDALVEKRMDDEKPEFGKSLRSSGSAVNVHPLEDGRKNPGKYKPANEKKK